MPDIYEGLEAHLDAAVQPADTPAPEKPAEAPAPEATKPAADGEKPAEQPKPDDKPAEPKPSEYAQKFLKLTAEERAARDRKTQLDKKEAELKTAEPELATAKEVLAALKDPKKALELMSKHGLTLKQLNDARVEQIAGESGDQKPAAISPELDQALKKLAQVEEELAALKNERTQEKQETVLQKFDRDVRETIQSPDFEHVQAEGEDGVKLVKAIVEQHLQKTGKLLEYKEAARLAEAHFEQKIEKHAQTKKFKSRHAPVQPPPKQDENEEPRTLSGDAVTRVSGGGSGQKNVAEESFEEFLERKFGT